MDWSCDMDGRESWLKFLIETRKKKENKWDNDVNENLNEPEGDQNP